MGSVLVAYASKYGSTKEVAEAIVATLREQGVDAVAQSAGEVTSLEGRSAVILVVALYFFRWRGEAHRFLKRNRAALAALPVALFGMGPIEDTPEQFKGAREHLDKGLAKHPHLVLDRAMADDHRARQDDSIAYPSLSFRVLVRQLLAARLQISRSTAGRRIGPLSAHHQLARSLLRVNASVRKSKLQVPSRRVVRCEEPVLA